MEWNKWTMYKMGNVSTETETLRKSQKEMQEINILTGMKNAFNGPMNKLDTKEERNFPNWKATTKKNQHTIQEMWDNYQRFNIIDLPDPGMEPLCLLHWQVGSLPLAPPGKSNWNTRRKKKI